MRHLRLIPAIALIVMAAASLFQGGCANIIPPAGGPRDTIPPVLVDAQPADSIRNFSGTRVQLTFDEYVELNNAQQEVIISPTPPAMPVIDYRLNTVTVRFRDTLEANTTYAINFGNSIRDINENNVLSGYTFVFSTGRYLDSLELSGRVLLAESGGIDTTLIVMLHSNLDDSAVINEKPRYVTRLDSKGNFRFKNLPPRTFHIYTMKDDGGSRRYFSNQQLFGFADSAITVSGKNNPVTLYASSIPDPKKISIGQIGTSRNERTGSDRRLRFSTTVSGSEQDLLTPFAFNFDVPLRKFDSTKISLYSDSVMNPVSNYRFILDSNRKKLTLAYSLKENTLYHIVADVDFAEDTTGKKLLRTDTLSFITKKASEYGEVLLRIRNLDVTKNPVLMFVQNNQVVSTFPVTSNEFRQALFLPGEYELRILYDENRNGRFDPHDFFNNRKQPEKVIPVPRRFTIRKSWVNEFEIAL